MAGAVLPVFPSPDYGFAFNDVNFSDRVMRIEILPDLPRSEPDPDDRNRKRRRDDPLSNANANGPGVEEPSTSMEYLPVQVRTVHISSPILAAKSPFFHKLFSNGMMESEQRHATLRIHVSEEAAVMDLLNFMYSNTLPRTTPTALLDVLMAADKFEVASCITYCSHLLSSLPMTKESALLYLDLPSTFLMADTVQQLIDAAKKFLVASFKDLSKNWEEVGKLPLAGIEAVLSSDDLQVDSEDVIYDFVLKWARAHYSKLEERREILGKRVLRLVRFPFMSYRNLKNVLTCSDIDPEVASEIVLAALFFKAKAPYRPHSLLAQKANASVHHFVERSYRSPAVKVVVFDSPWQLCVVYLHLKREECAQLFPSGKIFSQTFLFGGQAFVFVGICKMPQNSSPHCFTLSLCVLEQGSVAFTVNYEVAVRMNPSMKFTSMSNGKHVCMGQKRASCRNVLVSPWTSFMADNSPYFINDVLHVRAELMIKK